MLDTPNHHDYSAGARQEADRSLLVKFFLKPKQDRTASEKEGRPIFKDVEYVDIKVPGDRGVGACRPATDLDRKRFPEHYRAFKDRIENEPEVGTPLSEWGIISRSLAEEMSFFNIKTVEQLATMADGQAARFMTGLSLKEKARLWLESREKEKPLWEADQKMKTMQSQVDELKEQLGTLIGLVKNPDPTLNERQQKLAQKRAVKAAEGALNVCSDPNDSE